MTTTSSEPLEIPINIKCFNFDTIRPNQESLTNLNLGGSKIVIIGSAGSGKTSLIRNLFYAKRHLIPCAMVISGTEYLNKSYSEFIPDLFIHDDYDENIIRDFIKRQAYGRTHLENPWAILLIDDCADKPSNLNSELQTNLFKNGRHYNMLYILSMQYCLDVSPAIRTNIDGVFIFRETNPKNREKMWNNYAGVIPDFRLFCDIMDTITGNYTALYIDMQCKSNNWQDAVYWYSVPPHQLKKEFTFGSETYWKHHAAHFNKDYVYQPKCLQKKH